MAKHIVDHKQDKYIKLAQITEVGRHAGKWRPEWHERNSDTGLWGHGGNAIYKKFIIPSEVKVVEGQLSCRSCGETKPGWKVWGEGVTDHMRAVRINKIREHEEQCKGRGDGKKEKRSQVSKTASRVERKNRDFWVFWVKTLSKLRWVSMVSYCK